MQAAGCGEANPETPVERCVVIAGVGLIGGSIAAAVRSATPGVSVIGTGRSAARLQSAQDRGLLTGWTCSISPGEIPSGSLGVVCLPVDQVADTVRSLLAAGCGAVTDAGSTKGEICEQLSSERLFVGAHPIAGSEQSGFEHADGELFRGRMCVICAGSEADRTAVLRVENFWRHLGMSLRHLTPAVHDRILALTSHLPHVLAAVAVGVVSDEQLAFAGSGFRDTTRIASGSTDVWASILLDNSEACVQAICQAEQLLVQYRDALERRDETLLRSLWNAAAERRRKLC